MKKISINDLGGSCIIPKVRGKREEDYDGYNDYNPMTLESGYEY